MVFIARKIVFAWLLFAAVLVSSAAETNHFCIVCGKELLHERSWHYKWGDVCEDCYNLTNHCSICHLPIRDGAGAAELDDGRLICRFCRRNAVLDIGEARNIFANTHLELIRLFGSRFELKFPDVAVNFFDNHFESKPDQDGVEILGQAHTVYAQGTICGHQVLLKVGAPRIKLTKQSAHEYTHLWINENRPADHVIDGDTTEAICELSSYKLMEAQSQPEEMQKILDSPYTHGEIKKLVEVERAEGIGFVLDWVKNSRAPNFETVEQPAKAWSPPVIFTKTTPPLPESLTFGSLLVMGTNRQAVINKTTFAVGEQIMMKLRNKSVAVRCLGIGESNVVLEVEGMSGRIKLNLHEERTVP